MKVKAIFLCSALLLSSFSAFSADKLLEQRLQLLERRVANITQLTLQVDSLKRESRELRGEIETQNHQLEQLKKKQRDIYIDIDERLSAMSEANSSLSTASVKPTLSTTKAEPTKIEKTTNSTAVGSVPTPLPLSSHQEIESKYQAAYALLSPQQRRYKEAAIAFKQFLTDHSESPLAPNAQYWLAEAYYVSQNNTAALKAFESVVTDYPQSPKVAGALFKMGRLHHKAGNSGAAKRILERVLKEHPNSSAVSLAKDYLKKIKQERN